jgi:hypothetical protein
MGLAFQVSFQAPLWFCFIFWPEMWFLFCKILICRVNSSVALRLTTPCSITAVPKCFLHPQGPLLAVSPHSPIQLWQSLISLHLWIACHTHFPW